MYMVAQEELLLLTVVNVQGLGLKLPDPLVVKATVPFGVDGAALVSVTVAVQVV